MLDVRLGDEIGVGSPLEVGKEDDIILISLVHCAMQDTGTIRRGRWYQSSKQRKPNSIG